jgi:hypothetical protein
MKKIIGKGIIVWDKDLFPIVSAQVKSRAASRLVRTMAGDSRNLLQTWLDTASTSGCLHVFYCSFAQTVCFFLKKC